MHGRQQELIDLELLKMGGWLAAEMTPHLSAPGVNMPVLMIQVNLARQTGRPFNELAQYYALERWLYRLAQSDYRNLFILKGALMLLVWKMPVTRPTRDIDLLGPRQQRPCLHSRGHRIDLPDSDQERRHGF